MSLLIYIKINMSDNGVLEKVKGLVCDNPAWVVAILAVLVVVCLVLLWSCVWKNKPMGHWVGRAESFGAGGDNVRRQTMDQPYFVQAYEDIVPSQALTPSQRPENYMIAPPGPSNPNPIYENMDGARPVLSSEEVLTKIPNLSDLLSDQARQQFLRDNNCGVNAVAADPWLWKLEETRKAESFASSPITDAQLVGQLGAVNFKQANTVY